MRIILKLLLSAVAVVVTAYILDPYVQLESFKVAILVAAVLSLFHIFLKPILVVLTIPVTLVTLGLFLWVINGALILLASRFIDGFLVTGFWWAVLFSFILAIVVSFLHKFVPENKGG